MTNGKAFRKWIFLGSLAFVLSAVALGAGCSGFFGGKADVEKNWVCDNEAD